jgi:hypothetical protein
MGYWVYIIMSRTNHLNEEPVMRNLMQLELRIRSHSGLTRSEMKFIRQAFAAAHCFWSSVTSVEWFEIWIAQTDWRTLPLSTRPHYCSCKLCIKCPCIIIVIEATSPSVVAFLSHHLPIMFMLMLTEIVTNDRCFGLAGMGQMGLEWNITVGGAWEVSSVIIPTIRGTSFHGRNIVITTSVVSSDNGVAGLLSNGLWSLLCVPYLLQLTCYGGLNISGRDWGLRR